MRHDVIIVGAGVAGSSLAIALGQAGRSVLLVDKARFPRHKPCGEGLMPEGVALLYRLGVTGALVARGARPFRGMRFRSLDGLWAEAEFPALAGAPEYGLVLRMTLALKSVKAALPVIGEALATGDRSARALARYETRRAEAVDDAVRLTRLLLSLTRHRPLAGRAVRRLGRDPDLFGKLLGVVSGTRRWRQVRLREKLALLRG